MLDLIDVVSLSAPYKRVSNKLGLHSGNDSRNWGPRCTYHGDAQVILVGVLPSEERGHGLAFIEPKWTHWSLFGS